MNSLPLVGAEVRRINAAFAAISRELFGVLASLRDVDLSRVGTPSADRAVATGMGDLQAALSRLQATAEDCSTAMRRHGIEETGESTDAVTPPVHREHDDRGDGE